MIDRGYRPNTATSSTKPEEFKWLGKLTVTMKRYITISMKRTIQLLDRAFQ